MAPSSKRRVQKAFSLASYPLIREFLAELIGTFILVLCVIGTSAQAALTNRKLASFFANRMGDGFGVMAALWISAGVSGGHLNPAMSFAMASIGKLEWKKVPIYWIAQYIGAFAAAACVFAVYIEAIYYRTGGNFVMSENDPGYAAIFAPYPAPYLSTVGAIVDSIVGTAMLLLCAGAIVDRRNCKVPLSHSALYFGLLIVGLGVSFNLNCGLPINPARDLSPRLFTYLIGWGPQVFSYDEWMWFWIPLVMPYIGAVLGAYLYIIFVKAHWPE